MAISQGCILLIIRCFELCVPADSPSALIAQLAGCVAVPMWDPSSRIESSLTAGDAGIGDLQGQRSLAAIIRPERAGQVMHLVVRVNYGQYSSAGSYLFCERTPVAPNQNETQERTAHNIVQSQVERLADRGAAKGPHELTQRPRSPH